MSDARTRARFIKQNIPVPEALRVLGYDTGPKIQCIWHPDSNPSLAVYPDHLYCFSGCLKSYSVIDLVMEVQKLDFEEAMVWIEETFNLDTGAAHAEMFDDSSKDDDLLWLEADKLMIKLLRPYITKVPPKVYVKISEDVWRCYAVWDALSSAARKRGEAPTKVVGSAARKMRTMMERRVKEAMK